MKIGVIGGGQLGRMMALAGTPLGMDFAFLDPAPDACAQALGEHIRADYGDQDHLRQLADEVDLVTFEFESVPAETVAFLSQFVPVYPSANALRIARDRWFEKSMFKDLGIPTPAFADIQSQADLHAAVAAIGLPAVMKTRTLGYDGKGQVRVRTAAELAEAWVSLQRVPCVLEQLLPLQRELSVLVARGADGQLVNFPVQQNLHRGGILAVTEVPAPDVPVEVEKLAVASARQVADALNYVGVLCIEFFWLEDGRLVVNEMAPRPHNSGHWTMNGADVSQFELQVR
eukprot:gene49300-60347_t